MQTPEEAAKEAFARLPATKARIEARHNAVKALKAVLAHVVENVAPEDLHEILAAALPGETNETLFAAWCAVLDRADVTA